MFGDKQFDVDDYFDVDRFKEKTSISEMSFEITLYIFGIVVVVVLLIACCTHCCCRRNRGQVLSPPTTQVQVQVPYPQQQYNAPYPTQVVTTYPVHTGAQVAYPDSPGQSSYVGIPPSSLNPASAPFVPPRPTYLGAPYTAPCYQFEPYLRPSAPSAPDANALPPCYDQAVGAKPPANNLYAPQ